MAYKSKAASRPPNSTWRLTLVLMAALLLALSAAALGQAQSKPAAEQPADALPAQKKPWVPIAFTRAGKDRVITLDLVFNRPARQAVLRAFGRAWTEPAEVGADDRGNLRIALASVPLVRVPTVFAMTPPDDPTFVFGELVAYPDRDVAWDANVTPYSCGTPAWFDQWSRAVGLPVRRVEPADLKTATLAPQKQDGNSLLILGTEATGRNLTDMLDRKGNRAANVIVLDARWMGSASNTLTIRPGDLQNALASLSTQKWAKPLQFSGFRYPNRILCNRWALAVSSPVPSANGTMPVLPLEIVGKLQNGPWAALIVIPWQEQLGRRAEADELLLEVMKAAARFSPKVETIRQGTLLYPEKVTYDPRTMAYCPALACMTHDEKPAGGRVLIVDLRGNGPIPMECLEKWTTHANDMNEDDRLLVLGDDPILDQWEWLKLDRTKKTMGRPRVVRLEDDQPWDRTYEIPLMLKLTELGVPLSPPSQQEEKKQ